MRKKAALHNLGCKVNAYETEAMRQMLEEAGYEIVPFAPGADVYEDFLFEIAPEDLAGYTLHGDFYTAVTLTEGFWRVTFPLENSAS